MVSKIGVLHCGERLLPRSGHLRITLFSLSIYLYIHRCTCVDCRCVYIERYTQIYRCMYVRTFSNAACSSRFVKLTTCCSYSGVPELKISETLANPRTPDFVSQTPEFQLFATQHFQICWIYETLSFGLRNSEILQL